MVIGPMPVGSSTFSQSGIHLPSHHRLIPTAITTAARAVAVSSTARKRGRPDSLRQAMTGRMGARNRPR
jgi:hypothetical protein